MAKQTFFQDDSVHIEWEAVEDQCHVHCLVYVWNKTVAKECYGHFVRLRSFIKGMGYGWFYSITPNPKFCEMYGGEHLSEQDGKEVMIWATQVRQH